MDEAGRRRLTAAGAPGGLAPLAVAAGEVLTAGLDLRTVVLVEGRSDREAVTVLAGRLGRDLTAEGIAVCAMGGATNLGHFLGLFGPGGLGVRVAALCDEQEAAGVRRGLERAGLAGPAAGVQVCVQDLEDELVRALGTDAVERVVAATGELGAFRSLQQQPAQQGWSREAQLRRFLGTRGGRKVRYGRLLVEALDLDGVPGPLDRLLAAV